MQSTQYFSVPEIDHLVTFREFGQFSTVLVVRTVCQVMSGREYFLGVKGELFTDVRHTYLCFKLSFTIVVVLIECAELWTIVNFLGKIVFHQSMRQSFLTRSVLTYKCLSCLSLVH